MAERRKRAKTQPKAEKKMEPSNYIEFDQKVIVSGLWGLGKMVIELVRIVCEYFRVSEIEYMNHSVCIKTEKHSFGFNIIQVETKTTHLPCFKLLYEYYNVWKRERIVRSWAVHLNKQKRWCEWSCMNISLGLYIR